MLQDPLQDDSVVQNLHDKINIYLLHNLAVLFSQFFNRIDL